MEFLTGLKRSYDRLFVEQNCVSDIQAVIAALEQQKEIAALLEKDSGSFSTIFLPFHIGVSTYNKSINMRDVIKQREGLAYDPFEGAEQYRLRDCLNSSSQLYRFCELAGRIESLTDDVSIAGDEPSDQIKAQLLPLLREFLQILPDQQVFYQWVAEGQIK